MRRNHFIIVGSGLAIAGALISMSGCSGSIGTEPPPCKGAKCQSSTGSTTTSSGSGGGGGEGGGPADPMKPTCEGNPEDVDPATTKPKVFNEDCSVFALFGAMGSSPDGTMKNPYPSLQQAIDKSSGRWIIACNKVPFVENVTTTNNVQIYGGFDCSDLAQWKRDSAVKTKLDAAKPDTIALTFQNNPKGEVSVKLQDFAIKALDAVAKGGSSIAVAVDDKVSAELLNSDVKAGNAQPGGDGQFPQIEMLDGVQPTTVGSPACYFTVQGGIGAIKTCPDGQSNGGDGGNGGMLGVSTGKGQPGKNGDSPDATHGNGGKGAADAANPCTAGQAGAKGTAGAAGLGGAELGTLSLTGIAGGDGTPGGNGGHGHGGGGGGGALRGQFCGGVEGFGASGGGGGSGACGGKGGGAGKAGGSSIAVIALGPNLKLTTVTLATGAGGKGGNGAVGTGGGSGGLGGPGGTKSAEAGSLVGCNGGKGGNGGDGGPGGGGRGGHSIGVLYKVTPISPLTDIPPPQGAAGTGGTTSGAPSGAPGTKATCWDLSKKMPCSP